MLLEYKLSIIIESFMFEKGKGSGKGEEEERSQKGLHFESYFKSL